MNQNVTKVLKLMLLMVLSGALGFFLMRGILAILPDQIKYLKGDGISGMLLVFLLLLLSYFTVVALHELGHLLTGLAQGFRFYMYVVGFLGIKRNENERIQFYLNTDLQLFGGIAGSFPTHDDPSNLRKMAWVVAAGPLTSLLTGAVFTWGAFAMLQQLTPDSAVLYKIFIGFLIFLAFMSIAIFAATTIPSRTGPFFTDRARFFRLIRGGKTAQIEQAVMQLIAFSYSGKRFRDLDLPKIQLIESDASPVMHGISNYYAYYYYLDLQEFEQALLYAKKMEQASDGMPVALKNEYLREAAFCYAFIEKDTEKALATWKSIEKFFEKNKSVPVLRTKIALLLAQDQVESAQHLLQKAFAQLGDPPSKGMDLLEKDLLEQLQRQMRMSQASL